ncbi:MAG TPA: hypothetical protein VL051_10805, partial [Burkholderiaceae bacterium]|nr:hypothetical protein [Burkholderiaceae bacterium]
MQRNRYFNQIKRGQSPIKIGKFFCFSNWGQSAGGEILYGNNLAAISRIDRRFVRPPSFSRPHASLSLALTSEQITALSEATLKGWALGSERFKAHLERQTERRVRPAKRGRPHKTP